MWPDRRILDLFKIGVPIIQAPMVAVQDAEIAIASCEAGALGSLACATLTVNEVRSQVAIIRGRVSAPINLNFFCHTAVGVDEEREAIWRQRLTAYYEELGLDLMTPVAFANRAPFDIAMCEVVEDLRPEVVSFHFGLPSALLLSRVKAAGCVVIASATIVKEAVWLEANGADAVIAQGAEAGGHRGMFLTDDVAAQPGTFALVPQIADAIRIPVIAAGGIADGRGVAAAFELGAAGVQVGSAYLRCLESKVSNSARAVFAEASDESTAITNLMTGRPARGVYNRIMREFGLISSDVPAFPHSATALALLKAESERSGRLDFTNLWAGQALPLAREMGARELTRSLATDGLLRLAQLEKL